MSVSLLNLERNIAKAGYGYATGAPSSTGLTTTIVDTSADSPLDTGDSNTLFANAWAKIEADSAGTPLNVGEISRITSYVASTGTLTVGRAYSNATTTTMTYGCYFGLPPARHGISQGIKEYVNSILVQLYYRRPFLLTLITDGDMETSGVTNWTASNTTLTKSTTTGITLGKQALRVLNTSANGYAQSASVNVQDDQSYLVAADLTVAVGTGTLELYDVTNSASIQTEDCDERQTRRIWFTASIPADCKQVAIRLKGTGASDDVYWDNVTLLNAAATEMALPSWFKKKQWLEKVAFWRAGSTSGSGVDAAVDALGRYSVQHWVTEDRAGYVPFKVQFECYPQSGALLIGQALSPYDELSSDSYTTEADADWVKAWALVKIGADKKDKDLLAIWLPEAQRLDKIWQPKWEGQRFRLGSPY